DISVIAAIMDSGPSKDFMTLWCPPDAGINYSNAHTGSACNGDGLTKTLPDINTINGNGYPTEQRLFAFSEGNWDSQKALRADQYGPGLCDPSHFHTHVVNEGVISIDMSKVSSMCGNTMWARVAARDLEAGSVSDVIAYALNALPPEVRAFK